MEPNRRFYLITHPRTASNLLVKVLGLEGQQPDVEWREQGSGYFFMGAVSAQWLADLGSKPIDEWTHTERAEVKKAYQDGFDEFEAFLQKAESNNKLAVIKEHAYFMGNPAIQWRQLFDKNAESKTSDFNVNVPERYTKTPTWSALNRTVLPDEFLRTWNPIILIRHPAVMFPSAARAQNDLLKDDNFQLALSEQSIILTMTDIRGIYDWYVNDMKKNAGASASGINGTSGYTWPIVIDADDVIKNTTAVTTKLCEIIGLDESQLQFEWKTESKNRYAADDPMSIAAVRMLSTLSASKGIMKDKLAGNIDLDVEAKKWKEEFGEEDGAMVESRVRGAMPDYEYMMARKLQV